MKKHLLLLLLPAILFMSCGKSEDKPDPAPVEVKPGSEIHIKRNTKLPTGKLVANSTNARFIHIWKADGRDLGLELNMSIRGYAWDSISQKAVKADYVYENTSDVYEDVAPGKYQVWVMLSEQPTAGSFAWAVTEFEVKKGPGTSLTKIFTSTVQDLADENWDTKE